MERKWMKLSTGTIDKKNWKLAWNYFLKVKVSIFHILEAFMVEHTWRFKKKLRKITNFDKWGNFWGEKLMLILTKKNRNSYKKKIEMLRFLLMIEKWDNFHWKYGFFWEKNWFILKNRILKKINWYRRPNRVNLWIEISKKKSKWTCKVIWLNVITP